MRSISKVGEANHGDQMSISPKRLTFWPVQDKCQAARWLGLLINSRSGLGGHGEVQSLVLLNVGISLLNADQKLL
jgi:hypothetical protein